MGKPERLSRLSERTKELEQHAADARQKARTGPAQLAADLQTT